MIKLQVLSEIIEKYKSGKKSYQKCLSLIDKIEVDNVKNKSMKKLFK